MSHHGILSTNQRLPLFLTFSPSPLTASVIHRPETPHLPTMRRPFEEKVLRHSASSRNVSVSTFLKAVACREYGVKSHPPEARDTGV